MITCLYTDDMFYKCESGVSPYEAACQELDIDPETATGVELAKVEETVRDTLDECIELFKCELDMFLTRRKEPCALLVGVCGRWNGKHAVGRIIQCASDLFDVFSFCDEITVEDIDGAFHVNGVHHDGSIECTLWLLTAAGYRCMQKMEAEGYSDREIQKKLIDTVPFRRKVHFARDVYGIKEKKGEKK